MTWTAEQEAAYQAQWRVYPRDMPKERERALAVIDDALWESLYDDPRGFMLADHLRAHGAELIELITPFVERKE